MTAHDELVSTMREFGLLIGCDKAAHADRLAAEGMSAAHLRVIANWAEAQDGIAAPGRFVSDMLLEQGRWRAFYADIVEAERKRRLRAVRDDEADTAPSHYNAGPPPAGACAHGRLGSEWCEDCASRPHAAPSGAPSGRRDSKGAHRLRLVAGRTEAAGEAQT